LKTERSKKSPRWGIVALLTKQSNFNTETKTMVKVGSLFKQGLSLISRQEFDRPVIRHRAEHGAKGAVKLRLEPFEHGGHAADEPADVSRPVAMARFAVRHPGRRAGVSANDVI